MLTVWIVGIGLAYAALGRVSRRCTMAIMCCGGFLFLVLQVFTWGTTVTIIWVFGARTFMSASFIAVQIYAEMVYPTDLRRTALGIATSFGWAGGMIWPALGNQLGRGNQILPMSLFGFKILMSGVCALLLPLETLARESEENDN
ncbi:organic cation/carnitine transporter 7-like protein [Tanacetum coccineum]